MIDTKDGEQFTEPSRAEWFRALILAVAVVVATRVPIARLGPIETDEFGYLEIIQRYAFPPHHTLFLAAGHVLGKLVGGPYLGFVALAICTSVAALVAAWWWLRGLVRPATAVAATACLAFAPVFWSYGALAGNYNAIVAVGCTLLGLASRVPRPWHPYFSACILALGTGYRQDIGTLWLPVFGAILWRHRWRTAIQALGLFTILNLAWLGAMLTSVGGWDRYRVLTAEFAHSAGYLNSALHLGFIDAPLRYSLKLLMALIGLFGIGLLVIPRGASRLYVKQPRLLFLIVLSILPATCFHLLIHFGVAGYAMHDVPAFLALIALGIGKSGQSSSDRDQAPLRLWTLAVFSATLFLGYPTDYAKAGRRGDFDLAFARHTRVGLRMPIPKQGPRTWRTINSTR